ncbi:hypothetical protein [Lysobacter niastensis]|uniref:Translocation/assembly module TamB n=1 Tax=Lysobacter niastensis TaxID=380629 RepID=A0ABS0B8E5_9GAMM|nr:hypothetical protein [Lysobacter niastensis]MBF6024498.1 hypothetical protein [Lysobacter niastensis]
MIGKALGPWLEHIPHPLRPWLKWGALALLVLYGGYVLLGNLFLNTPLGPWAANRKPEKFQIEWGPGVTWWPGRVTVWDVRMKGHVGRTVWAVQADKARGRLALLPLLHKEVRVPEVVADGVSGDVDQTSQRRPPPVPRPGGWVLNFQRIHTDTIRRGRFAKLVLEGQGSADVGFYKQLRGGPLEMLPSQAHFPKARLSLDKHELLRDAAIDARFAIARHTRAQAPGVRKLLMTDAELSLDGTTAGLHVVAQPGGKVAFSTVPAKGKAHVRLGFARGSMKPGSQLRWHMPVTGVDATGRPREQALDLQLDVDRDMHVVAKAPARESGPLALDADLRIRGTQVPLTDFRSLVPRSSGHVVGRWQFPSLKWLGSAFIQAPWLSLEGAGVVDADVQVADGKVAAGSRVGVPDVQAVAVVMGNRIQGRARADGRLDAGEGNEVLPRLDLVMEEFNIAAADAPNRPYVTGRNLRLDVQTLSGVDRAQLRRPGGIKEVGELLKAHLTFQDAQVPDLRAYNRYLPKTHMRFDGGSGLLSGDLNLDTSGDIGQGWLRVKGNGTRMSVAGMAVRGNLDVNTKLRRADLGKRQFNLDGSTVNLADISFTEPGGESRSGWWARIELDRARLAWGKPVGVNGTVQIAMKDVGFLLSMFSRQREYPKWVYKLVDAGQARVHGNVQWQDDTLTLDRMVASNQRFDLKARLRLKDKTRKGSLFARWGVLSMAVEVDSGRRDFHMMHAEKWYDSQPALIR